jgi:hydroxypyruvate reductase
MYDTRALLTALYEAAVQGAAPLERTHQAVYAWAQSSLLPDTRVHLAALGKAAPRMAAGAVQALAARQVTPHRGLVVSAQQLTDADRHALALPDTFTLVTGDHPVPWTQSLDAADAIDDAVAAVEPGDVCLVLLSGGTTALCAAPLTRFTQAVGSAERAQTHLANLAQTLLETGLAIHEMNAIRRRVLRWGAGRLAVALARRGAVAIPVFAISDVIGDDPAVIGSGPCTADPFDDAQYLALLDGHDLRAHLERPTSIALGVAGSATPPVVPAATDPAFALVRYEIVARNADAVNALAAAARDRGVRHVHADAAPLAGEAAALGELLVERALSVAATLPRGESALLVHGGEPTVHLQHTVARAMDVTADGEDDEAASEGYHAVVLDDTMVAAAPRTLPSDEALRGGRMQLLALSASLALEAAQARGHAAASRITVLAAGTDGRDGPTDAAGAIVDAATPALARRAGRSPDVDAATGRSWYSLDEADALLRTGPTGTNVMDVVALMISR